MPNDKYDLMKRAAALIAGRGYSRGELRRKLVSAVNADTKDGLNVVNTAEIEATLDRLEQLNLLNDAEYAYNFILYRVKESRWGEEKIREALLKSDIENTVADRALERVREELAACGSDGIDGIENALMEYIEGCCRKHGTPATLKDAHKLARRLAGRGFDEDRIMDALRRITPSEIFRHFEI